MNLFYDRCTLKLSLDVFHLTVTYQCFVYKDVTTTVVVVSNFEIGDVIISDKD